MSNSAKTKTTNQRLQKKHPTGWKRVVRKKQKKTKTNQHPLQGKQKYETQQYPFVNKHHTPV